jgi:hypothetical protein
MPDAYHITFFGTQPTLTQVPPRRAASISSTRAPYSAARRARGDAAAAAADGDQVVFLHGCSLDDGRRRARGRKWHRHRARFGALSRVRRRALTAPSRSPRSPRGRPAWCGCRRGNHAAVAIDHVLVEVPVRRCRLAAISRNRGCASVPVTWIGAYMSKVTPKFWKQTSAVSASSRPPPGGSRRTETRHFQPALLEALVHRLELAELPGEAAVAGGVDHQHRLAGEAVREPHRCRRRAGGAGSWS